MMEIVMMDGWICDKASAYKISQHALVFKSTEV
jgi:hypothetical protein